MAFVTPPIRRTPTAVVAAVAAAVALLSCSAPPDTPAPRGMVTGTTGAQAIEGGVEILRAGGSAADAASRPRSPRSAWPPARGSATPAS